MAFSFTDFHYTHLAWHMKRDHIALEKREVAETKKNNQWDGKRKENFLTPSNARRELSYRLLLVMLIDGTTCVSHTLLAELK